MGRWQEKIAIIGGGPAGLSCAYYLAQMGYYPTVGVKVLLRNKLFHRIDRNRAVYGAASTRVLATTVAYPAANRSASRAAGVWNIVLPAL